MKLNTLYIKNMVCPRCIDTVKDILDNLNIETSSIELGEVHTPNNITSEGVTIERFILKQKVERVKELIFYNELTLSEIAHQMDYSSVAHLSAQFKKETGMTPTAFKKMRNPGRQSLDQL